MAVSFFPNLPQLDPTQTYATIVETARAEFQKYAGYSDQGNEIDGLTKDWTQYHKTLVDHTIEKYPTPEELQADLNTKLDTYVKYRVVRNDLLRIINIYNVAILNLTPPALDLATLTVLQRLNANVVELKAKYDTQFTENRNQLIEQAGKIRELYAKFKTEALKLKLSLEPLAKLVNPAWGMPQMFNQAAGRAPWVDAALAARGQAEPAEK